MSDKWKGFLSDLTGESKDKGCKKCQDGLVAKAEAIGDTLKLNTQYCGCKRGQQLLKEDQEAKKWKG